MYIILYTKTLAVDILNFISWIKGGRVVTSVDPAKTLLPVGLRDNRRDDGYLAGAISVEDFAKQVKGYKAYTVSIGQGGDSAPGVAMQFENTLEVTATFFRDDVGLYVVEFDKPLFNSPFDYCVIQNPISLVPQDPAISYVVEAKPIFDNVVAITSFADGVLSDNVMGTMDEYSPNTILEIRVYDNAVPIF